jgi:anti-sigma factor RsiW
MDQDDIEDVTGQEPDREIESLRAEVAALRGAFSERLNAGQTEARKREREQRLQEFESRRKQIATSAMPPEQRAKAFEDETRRQHDAILNWDAEDRRQSQQPQVRPLPKEVTDWGSRNTWFFALKKTGSSIADEAEALHMTLQAQGVPLKENLEEVTRRMAERYPHIVAAPGERKDKRLMIPE